MFSAAEGLLVLFIFNGGAMFLNPFAAHQLGSWILMLISAGLAIFGFYALKEYGCQAHTFHTPKHSCQFWTQS
jgi:hypothetical protein